MTELWIWEDDRTHQYFCDTMEQALEKAAEALKRGRKVEIIPNPEPERRSLGHAE